MDELLQQQRAAREAGRAKRRAARPARRPGPSPVRADDSTSTAPRPAAWNEGNSVSAAGQTPADDAPQIKRTDARMRLRDGIQPMSVLDSVRGCETAPLGEVVGITAREGKRTGFSGLMRCSSVWACPVCAARIRAQRAATLERYAMAWLEDGRGLYLVTLTVPHWARVRLADYTDDKGRAVAGQLSKLLEAWRGIGQGSWWVGRQVTRHGGPVLWSDRWRWLLRDRAFPKVGEIEPHTLADGREVVWKKGFTARHGVAGTTRTAEITDGANGWHSHLHALVWTEQAASRETAEKLEFELSRRWAARCKAVGLPTPDAKVGCRVDPATRDRAGQAALARYIAKVQEQEVDGSETSRALASELVRGDVKLARGAKGRTPYDLAALAIGGDETARGRWNEFERATKGRRCLTWSHGLQDRLAALLGETPEEDDDQALNDKLAEEEARQPNLGVARRPFRQAVAHRRGGRADVAMAGYVGGRVAVEELLTSWGLLPGVDFWRLDTGPRFDADGQLVPSGLPTTPAQLTRARKAREAHRARLEAADAVPASRTPQEWAALQEARRTALQEQQEPQQTTVADDDEADERAAAHADFRARLRAVKASR